MEESEALSRVEVVAYDPAWPADYAVERAELIKLSGGAVLALEHIGSTAVPGLAAKPIIDMMAAVADLHAGRSLAQTLAVRGYRLVETGMRHRLFLRRRAEPDHKIFQLHIVENAAWPARHERLMRDHLLGDPGAARAYAELKSRLARDFAEDSLAYTRAKTAFIQALVDRACAARGLPPIDVWND
jgi:GrpB-like predicted nucleotidyltransferase (UPF0157 family)